MKLLHCIVCGDQVDEGTQCPLCVEPLTPTTLTELYTEYLRLRLRYLDRMLRDLEITVRPLS